MYKIEYNPSKGIFVTLDGVVMGGPYKNDESAKRRIRDLKQRDADKAETERNVDLAGGTLEFNNTSPNAFISPDPRKLLMSSAYGNSNYGTTPAGVYPAVGKNEYRRRWNTAITR